MNSKEGWGVHLSGHAFDVADWADTLKQPFDPWIEQRDDQFFLRSQQFDVLPNAEEVRARAFDVIGRLSAAMEISVGSRAITFEGVVKFAADSTRKIHMFLEGGTIEVRSRLRAAITTGNEAAAPKESDAQRWIMLSEGDALLADALIYFSRTEWFDVYKAIECLEDWVGGEEVLRSKGWINAADLKRLKRTANSFRHRKGGKHSPPADPFSLRDARKTLGTLLRKAFEAARIPGGTGER